MMSIKTRNVWLQIITGTLILALVVWQGRRARPVEFDSGYRQTMGTFARVLVVAADKPTALAAIEAAFAVIDRVNSEMSDYNPDSLLSQVNREAFAAPVEVTPELFEVLSAAVEYSELSGGAFDVTVGSVVQVWRRAKQTSVPPTEEELAAAGSKVGYRHLMLDAEAMTVRFGVEGMALDVGGIAKGYAVDVAVAAMRQAGATGGMVDIGGNIRCFGAPVGGKPSWRIGLQDPARDDHTLLTLTLDAMAVATSGDYRRFSVLEGQKYSHIVNPASAKSVRELSSVSILAPTAMRADALSTAVSVMGEEKGRLLIESLPETEAIMIRTDQPDAMILTSGVGRFLNKGR